MRLEVTFKGRQFGTRDQFMLWLRAAIQAVKPANVTGITIAVKNGRAPRGMAYTNGLCFRGKVRTCQYVVIALNPKQSVFPVRYPKGNGYLGIICYTQAELALMLLAHELRHCWQRRVPRGWRVWGSRGQMSERDADAYALQMLRRYRRGELELPYL